VARHTAVVLDRFPLWLEAVEVVVMSGGFDAVESTRSPDEALRLLQTRQPELHVVGFDTSTVEIEGLAYLKRARDRAADVNILVLSSDADPTHIDAALRAGAYAYVLKTAEPDDLAAAIRQAFEHTMHFPGLVEPPPVATTDHATSGLTSRELEVLQLAAEGRSNAQVARQLLVSEPTVKFHLSNIYKKLEISNRTEASRWAQAHGLLQTAV
jgi:DNA-binding NarL/FixJ family response regulator